MGRGLIVLCTLHHTDTNRQKFDDLSDLRIAIFSGNYNCVQDGANRALNRLAGYLLERGAAVRIYSPTCHVPAFEPIGDLISVPSFPIPFRSEYRIAPWIPSAIRKDIEGFRPTHFHVSAPDWLGTSAQALAKALGLPIVASLHTRFEKYLSYYHLNFLAPWMNRRLQRFYADSDFVLVPNQPIADEFSEPAFEGKVAVWGRGIDREAFSPALRDLGWRRALGYADREPIVLFLGRLVAEKGIGCFADAIGLLRRRGHGIRPLVIGDGPMRQRMSTSLGDASFLGHLAGPDLGRAIASADILINPSTTEAFGNVNLEAMASGLAIVSADVASARALIVHDKTGLLVEPANPAAYADAVKLLVEKPHERAALGRLAEIASRDYEWGEACSLVASAYRAARRSARQEAGLATT